MDAIERAKRTPIGASELLAWCRAQLNKHANNVTAKLEDMPEIRSWTWQRPTTGTASPQATRPMP